jgi:hypothetical protein
MAGRQGTGSRARDVNLRAAERRDTVVALSDFSQLNRFKVFPLICSDDKVQCGCNLEEL